MTDWALGSALQGVLAIIVQPLNGKARRAAHRPRPARYNRRLDPMSLIQASDLSKSYGAHDVFSGLSLSIPHQARIALVGPNGIGKSTLLRVLAGYERPDAGHIQRAKSLDIGYLPQEAQASDRWSEEKQRSLQAICLDAFDHLQRMMEELARLEAAMADPRQAADALEDYGPIQERFEREGGYRYEAETLRVLRGLGFDDRQFDQPIGTLSGGERTRAYLARLLLEDPGLLILDEPTNHLDIDAIEWLETWLADWPGAALIVSHDRYFLDRTVDQVWELSPNELHSYRGNYTAYIEQRRMRRDRRAAIYQSQQEHIEREQEYIRRNIAGQNTRQAQGRRKRLERFLEDEAISAPESSREVSIAFGSQEQAGEVVLETEDLVVGRDGVRLFSVPDLKLRRGECAAIIGPNGAGKSTFLKTLIGELPPVGGRAELGHKVTLGYFAQAHEGLDPARTVLEAYLASTDSTIKISEARHQLARFLFRGDMVDRTVGDLSGGERGRLALARLARQGANLLLLDEPTNHLDLSSQEVLQAALVTFPGTILLVSHDRYLIDGLATQVWPVRPELGELQIVGGGYDGYLAARQARDKPPKPEQPSEPEPQRQNHSAGATKRRLQETEERVEAIEQEMAFVAAEIERVGDDHERVRQLGDRYSALQSELDERLFEWEQLSQRLESP
jgi:ATP-binding cassette subfamily F protein 3